MEFEAIGSCWACKLQGNALIALQSPCCNVSAEKIIQKPSPFQFSLPTRAGKTFNTFCSFICNSEKTLSDIDRIYMKEGFDLERTDDQGGTPLVYAGYYKFQIGSYGDQLRLIVPKSWNGFSRRELIPTPNVNKKRV
jgi:hypothetical protein